MPKSLINNLLRDPLLHFLCVGLAVFVLSSLLNPEAPEDKPGTIHVDRAALIQFMQYQTNALGEGERDQALDAMTPKERRALIADYVQEESLYREAKALNIEANSYSARRRLVQQMRYLTRRFIDVDITSSPRDIELYYQENLARYAVPAKITFTHVFISLETRGKRAAETLAKRTLVTLNAESVPFHQGLSFGDRFLYHHNYVGKEADEIASHFGEVFQQALFAINPDGHQWRGPFISPYGYHLVMVTRNEIAYQPDLSEVKQQVEFVIHQFALDDYHAEALQAIAKNYAITIAGDLQ